MAKRGRPKKGNVKKAEELNEALTTPEVAEAEDEDAYEGLSDRQRTIARMKLRGLSQNAMANVLGVSQPIISREMKRIRKHLQDRGAYIDQDYVIGETQTIYEEVLSKAWEIYHTSDGDASAQTKALSLVLSSREKHVKLLMDLGRIERAGNKTTVEIRSPLLEEWDKKTREEVSAHIIDTTLSELPAPKPPEEDEEFDIIDEDD